MPRFPPKLPLDAPGIGNQGRGIAGTARALFHGQAMADHALNTRDHLAHRQAPAIAAIVDLGGRAAAERIQRQKMGGREIGDVDAMAAAGIRLLTDPALWLQMSTTAAADARKRFSEEAVVAQYEALYERTIASAVAGR